MKLGFFTAILPDLSFREILEFAAENNFSCLEAACWPAGKAERKFAGVTHIDVTGLTSTRADDLNADCASHGICLSALGFYPNPLDPNPQVSKHAVAHFKKVVLAAQKLGVKNANTFVGRDWSKSVEENWPRFLKTWRPIIAFAEDHGVKVGIENCPMSFTQD